MLMLSVVAVFLIVRGYDRSHSRENLKSSQIANTRAAEEASLSAPSTDKENQSVLNEEKQIKGMRGLVRMSEPANAVLPQVEANPPQPPLEIAGDTFQHVFQKDSHGNFIGYGTINGKSVRFIADTGANFVTMSEKIAQQIGLSKGKPMPMSTAGGVDVHYGTNLDSLTLGPIELRNVSAAIAPKMPDDFILLGMSALGLLEMQMQQGTLVLKYKPSSPDIAERQPVNDQPFKRSYKDCADQGNKFDQKSLDCLRGK